MRKWIFLLLTLILFQTGFSLTSNTLSIVDAYVPNSKIVGSAQYKYYFFNVYRAYLFAPKGEFNDKAPYALTLAYQRSLSGDSISEKTIELIAEQNKSVSKNQLEDWDFKLKSIFPNVVDGSELTGILTAEGKTIFYNQEGEFLGEIKDKQFGPNFFDIWLGENTLDTSFTQELLGEKND
ncbi:chalcone isomerase family protein [Francisellaceae bacterium]|nr:chalcone isomerase family protein [Francisellaceae bacterium]